MNIQYYADDGTIKNLGDDELQHYKYIKKIKAGSGWRYFYTPEELKAYYEGSKAAYKLGNTVLDKRGDSQTKKKINSLERKKNATQEKNAWRAYEESKLRGNSDRKAYKDSAKSIMKDEIKYQVERKKLETKNELDKKKRAARSEVKALTGTAKLAGKGAKDAADSVPRLQKHGNKYYIADAKTQKKIERSGAGGNVIRKKGKAKGVYTLSDKTRNEAWNREYKDRAKNNKGSALKKANELAKSNAYKGAAKGITPKYEKYEAKNVAKRKVSSIKKKVKKTTKGKKRVNSIITHDRKITSSKGAKRGVSTYK